VGTNSTGDVQVSGGNLVGSDGSTGVLWRWDGSTWANVPIAIASITGGARLQQLDLRTSGWAFNVVDTLPGGTWVFRGVESTQGTTASESSIAALGIAIMPDGTPAVGTNEPSADDNIWYVDGSSLVKPGTTSGEDRDLQFVAAYPTGNRLIAPSTDADVGNIGRIYATENYRTTQPDLKISATTGYSAAVTVDERVYVGGGFGNTRTGIAEITDLFGTPSVSVVAASGVAVGRIGIDRQTRTLVAALNSAKDTAYLWDGSEETTIDASSLTAGDLADCVEVVS
jgi:hypothetical protein